MLILLDSNVWRYVLDANASVKLQLAAAKSRHRIAIAPAVLYEALRMKAPALRARLSEVMTRPAWQRLMPEAYSESLELKDEIGRLHPEWLREKADVTLYKQIRSDWRKASGGFWSRAREAPHLEHSHIMTLEGISVVSARDQARKRREKYMGKEPARFQDLRLQSLQVQLTGPHPGWSGEPVEAWRVGSWLHMTHQLTDDSSAHAEWLTGEVDLQVAMFDLAGWTRFWLHEVEAQRLPRMWLRWAMEHMQSFQKVTDGTPVDAQIASHAMDVDLIVSADSRFVAMCQRCQQDAPFKTAGAAAVPSGQAGVEELLNLVVTH
jgi:hypothetical protein